MTIWIMVLAAGVLSFALRFVPVALLAGRRPTPRLQRVGGLIVPVAFAVLATTVLAGLAPGPPSPPPWQRRWSRGSRAA